MRLDILIIYYSQTGQLKDLLSSIAAGMGNDVTIDFAAIEPEASFPFPWPQDAFYDIMPQAMRHAAISLKPLARHLFAKKYDLVILGYQPWFLNPSLPVSSFLQSEDSAILQGKNVITVTGSCNMWLHAQEQVKKQLSSLNAYLVGHLAFTDCKPYAISVLTSLRWLIKGIKNATDLLPAAGVSAADIAGARIFGEIIYRHLATDNLINLQSSLLQQHGVQLRLENILAERHALGKLQKWAQIIESKGTPGSRHRLQWVNIFRKCFLASLYLISPIRMLLILTGVVVKKYRLLKELEYYRHTDYIPGRF